MPRAKPFFIAALLLALTAIAIALAARTASADFGSFNGTAVIPLKEELVGGLLPGDELYASLHTKIGQYVVAKCYADVYIVIEAGAYRVVAGIDAEPETIGVKAVIAIDDSTGRIAEKKVAEAKLGEIRDVYASVIVDYHCDGTVEVQVHSGDKVVSYRFAWPSKDVLRVYLFTGENLACESDGKVKTYQDIFNCRSGGSGDGGGSSTTTTTTNPYGAPNAEQHGDKPPKPTDDDQKLLVYAVAGLGAVVLLALLLPRGGGVVVVRGSRGMFQLVGLLLLLAFAAGGVAAWKLHSAVGGGGGGDTVLIAAAGLGLLLIFLLLMSRRQPTVVVVEGR